MSKSAVIASRVVSWEMHEGFAAFSGDRNPMHMDRAAARRTQAGFPVVHGVHTLLWALDFLAGSGSLTTPLSRIKVKFLKWVYPGDETTLNFEACADPHRFQVSVMGLPVLSADLLCHADRSNPQETAPAPSPAGPLPHAVERSFGDLVNCAGTAFTPSADEANRLFPQLAGLISATAVAELAACSYIVGMEAPGLYSMFSKLDLSLHSVQNPATIRAGVHYAVSYTDERFSKARLTVTGRGISGMLEVFVRSPPAQQPSMADVAAHVLPGEFAGMRALIVGGSRGLGELTAKVLAAGGAESIVTYAVGKSDADGVAAQILESGGEVEIMQYDVLRAAESQLEPLSAPVTHLFYFATNPIFRAKSTLVSASVLHDFVAFYLQGFHNLCVQMTQTGKPYAPAAKLIAFYPSSVFVEERPAGMTEYAMVKAAGEQMCRDMTQYLPNVEVLVKRLPRLPTDQTLGIVPERALDPIAVILPVVREMQSLAMSANPVSTSSSPD